MTNGLVEDEMDPALDPQQVIRVNYEKCTVDLRNRRLVQYASDLFGDTTSYVYAQLLRHLTKDISRCRLDPLVDHYGDKEDGVPAQKFVTTAEILDSLKTAIDLSVGLGKTTRKMLSKKAATAIHPRPPMMKSLIQEAEVQGDASSDEEDDAETTDDEDYDGDYKPPPLKGVNGNHGTNGVNGVNGSARADD